MSQIALNEEAIKEIVGESVQKAFYELNDRESEFHKELVDNIAEEAKHSIKRIAEECVNTQIREIYAKRIRDIVACIGTDMLADFIKNFDYSLREKLTEELSFYKNR
jgi:hypothetical protein